MRRFPTGRVYVCDGGRGRNVALAEEATDREDVPFAVELRDGGPGLTVRR